MEKIISIKWAIICYGFVDAFCLLLTIHNISRRGHAKPQLIPLTDLNLDLVVVICSFPSNHLSSLMKSYSSEFNWFVWKLDTRR